MCQRSGALLYVEETIDHNTAGLSLGGFAQDGPAEATIDCRFLVNPGRLPGRLQGRGRSRRLIRVSDTTIGWQISPYSYGDITRDGLYWC
jgi:hypothetical protein